MAALSSVNDYVARIGNGYGAQRPFRVEIDAATTATLYSGQSISMQKSTIVQLMESLPTGVTGYRLTNCTLQASVATNYMLAKLVNLGSLDISGASGTFTDGSAMPTVTEANNSNVTFSSVIAEVTTALNATPGSSTITYVDQDGNSAETSPSTALTASAALKTCGPVPLNTADIGVRDITAAARSAGTTPTGVIKYWGVVPLGFFAVHDIGTAVQINFLTTNTPPPLLTAGDELYFITLSGTTAKHLHGMFTFVGDQA